MTIIQRRNFIVGGAALATTAAIGCTGSAGNLSLAPGVRDLLRPFGIALPAIDGLLGLTNAIANRIAERQRLKLQRGLYEIGQGTRSTKEMVQTGTELPGPYRQAYDRVISRVDPETSKPVLRPDGFSDFLNPGDPILPVYADPAQVSFFEGQFFEGDVYGHTMKLLFMKGHTGGNTVRPVPEVFADVYLRRDKCLGHPMGDPEWGHCSGCGALQVRQRFMGHPKGVISTFSDPIPDHAHDGEGEPIKGCTIKTTEMDGPTGGVCDVV